MASFGAGKVLAADPDREAMTLGTQDLLLEPGLQISDEFGFVAHGHLLKAGKRTITGASDFGMS